MSHTIAGARIGRKTTFRAVNPDILEHFVAGYVDQVIQEPG